MEIPKDPKEFEALVAKIKLTEIDTKCIRAIREWIASQESAPQILKDYETQAIVERGKMK